jgi:hypothetical protein
MARTAKITNANVGPLKNKGGSVGNTPVRAQDFNVLVGDYISKTDAVAQSVTSAVTVTGTLAASAAATVAGVLSLGDKTQAAGVLTSKLDTGILNAPMVFTTPAPAATQTAGGFTLTAAMFANGFIVGTANHATSSTVTMPAKSVFIALFGAARVVGDTFIYRIHNAGTSVNEPLVWTGATGATLIGQIGIGANTATGEASEELGTSTGTFMARLTNVDGSTKHYRLS